MTWRRADYAMNHGDAPGSEEIYVSPYVLERRVYRTGKREWPRLVMATRFRDGQVILSSDEKCGPTEWWIRRDGIPPELIDDAIEMLTAAKARVKP